MRRLIIGSLVALIAACQGPTPSIIGSAGLPGSSSSPEATLGSSPSAPPSTVSGADGTAMFKVTDLSVEELTFTATDTTHVTLDLAAHSGYSYDDRDPALAYTGAWSHVGPEQSYTGGDYLRTESFSNVAGDTVTVPFTGTAIRWISTCPSAACVSARTARSPRSPCASVSTLTA